MGFLEKYFGKRKEKRAEEPAEESFDIEAAAAFLKKKYEENLQLLNNEVKNAMQHKKRSVRNQRVLNLFIITKKNELLKPVADAEKELDLLKKNLQDVEEKKKDIDESNRTLLELKRRLVSEEENLRKLEASDEWNRLNQLRERRKLLDSHISETRADISQSFSRIEKPLRKFQHLVKMGKEKIENEKMLDRYLDSPVDALVQTEDFSFINSILEGVKRSISSGALNVKDKNESLSEINSVISDNIFEKSIMQHKSLTREEKELEEDIIKQNAEKSRNEIETRIQNSARDAQAVEGEIERNKRQLETIKGYVRERKDSLKRDIQRLKLSS